MLQLIGVLSVGAIAGYSMATFKYKLNKHAEAVNMLINNSLILKDKVAYGTNMPNILEKTNSLPDGIYLSRNRHLYDRYFNVPMWVYWNKENNFSYGGIQFKFSPTAQGAEICRNIALTAKENSANLHSFRMRSLVGSSYTENTLYGGLSTVNYDLLQNATIKQIDDMCASCDSEVSCQIVMYLNLIRYQ